MRTSAWCAAALVYASALLGARFAHAQGAVNRPNLHVSRTTTPPRIDGLLDDAVWSGEALPIDEWLSYNPVRGDRGPERTEVRITYDDRNIYFAFHCMSEKPDTIRTTVSRRDSVFNDDWVGFSLDSTGAGQSAYHLMINPSGVQMDAVNTTASGEKFETDFVWYSAGRRTPDGYSVEVALPLESIRFSSSVPVTMGVLFWRHVSRSGVSYAWPDLPPGQWVFDRHAHLVFDDLKPRRLVELLPSVTLPLSQTRTTPESWSEVAGKPDFGVSGKFGVTSQITIDATVNPDFSQVESDAFQVQVNQRFPVFFPEKRPFFMEGMGLFNTSGTGGDFNMRTAVHTRRIVDPGWGAKVIGTAGQASFGVLTSSDDTPEGGEATADTHTPNKFFTIVRATYGLGGSNYVGAILTETDYGGRRNSVIGGDAFWKPGTSHTLTATALYSETRLPDATASAGAAVAASYRYDTRRMLIAPIVEHYDAPFQMDTAFYNRTGFTTASVFSEVNVYPDAARRLGIIRIHPLVQMRAGQDHLQRGSEAFVTVGTAFDFNRQGFLRIQHTEGHEAWTGQRFRTGDPFGAFGGAQLTSWLQVNVNYFHEGWSTSYDPVDPFQGRSTTGGADITWQPTAHFSQGIWYSGVRFSRADTGAPVFSVDILNAKTIYQFNTHLFVRLIEQFDSSHHQALTDLLASYELVPGTVFHAGYGSLLEQRDYRDGQLVSDSGRYMAVSRGLFFKASYLHRF